VDHVAASRTEANLKEPLEVLGHVSTFSRWKYGDNCDLSAGSSEDRYRAASASHIATSWASSSAAFVARSPAFATRRFFSPAQEQPHEHQPSVGGPRTHVKRRSCSENTLQYCAIGRLGQGPLARSPAASAAVAGDGDSEGVTQRGHGLGTGAADPPDEAAAGNELDLVEVGHRWEPDSVGRADRDFGAQPAHGGGDGCGDHGVEEAAHGVTGEDDHRPDLVELRQPDVPSAGRPQPASSS